MTRYKATHRGRWRGGRYLSSALVTVVAFSAAVAGITVVDMGLDELPASAATNGAGFHDGGNGWLGNYIGPDGSRAYCMDVLADAPAGTTAPGIIVTSLGAISGTQAVSGTSLAVLNYGLTKWGQTSDPYLAAAVAAFVYAFTSQNHPGYAGGIHYINSKAPGESGSLIGLFNTMWNESWAAYNSPGSNTATLHITMANSYDGSVTVSVSPISATGTLTLSGATVVGTGLTTAPVANGSVIPIKGNPLDGQNKYAVQAAATFTGPGGSAQNVTLYTTGSKQRIIKGGTPSTVSFSAASFVTDPLPLEFAPIVSTLTASQFIQPGDSFIDTLTANVAAGSQRWRQRADLSFVSVVAKGTLYGPFSEKPTPAASPPSGAPIVGTGSVTLAGPGTYQSPAGLIAPEAGYYTWVWSIDAADQGVVTRSQLPVDYLFTDEFGLVAETHIVPSAVEATSQVSETSVGLGATVSDQLTVSLKSGTWLTEAGAPVPSVFNGTAYFVPGTIAPVPSSIVPPEAWELGTATVTAAGPGVYTASASVSAPVSTAGFITWMWALDTTTGYGSYFLPWADQFGLPNETTRVDAPLLSTLAVPETALGNPSHDVATVGGAMPADDTYLGFEAFLQTDGQPPLCTADTRVFDSLDVAAVKVSSPGEYVSPETTFTEYGTYFWIATLYSKAQAPTLLPDIGNVITRGECGDPGETTVVSPADVRSVAVAQARIGAPAHDTAIVTGLVQTGASVIFEAFAQSTESAVCTVENRVFSSEADPVMVNGPGEYVSPLAHFKDAGKVYWRETLLDRDGKVLDVGSCGVAGETTLVTLTPPLASSGLDPQSPAILAGGLFSLGSFMLLVAWVWRRRFARR